MATLPYAIISANQKAEEKKRFGRVTLGHKTDRVFNPNEEEYNKLFKHIKKQTRRIKRLQLLIKGPETPGNAELYASTRARILKCEKIISNCFLKIKQREAEKSRIDLREIKKHKNRQAIENLEKVRLEKNQLVDYVSPEVEEGSPPPNKDRLTILVKAKGYTNKNPVYEETSMVKIRKDFINKVNKPEPKPRTKTIEDDEPFPYMKKKRMLQRYYENQ